MLKNADFWENEEAIKHFLKQDGNRDDFIETVVYFYKSLRSTLHLFKNSRLDRFTLEQLHTFAFNVVTMSADQRYAYGLITTTLKKSVYTGGRVRYS